MSTQPSREDLLKAYRMMKTIREFEERVHTEFATGEIPGFVHLYAGEEASATGICMHLLKIPPGGRAKAHKHENHETAIFALSGESHVWYGERLETHTVVRAGEMFYIPAGVPHLPANLSDRECVAIIARTDPHEQESVVLLPELERLVDFSSEVAAA